MTAGNAPKKTIARSLGEMFGHVMKGVKTPVKKSPAQKKSSQPKSDQPARQEVQRTVQEEEIDGVVFRRTTIDEIEYGDTPKERDDV